jgi:hypothetical protein
MYHTLPLLVIQIVVRKYKMQYKVQILITTIITY